MPFVERGAYRLHYRVAGSADAPPLLLVMGLGMCSLAWHTLPARLAARFRVLAVDNRGVGGSTAARGGFRIGDLAEDAAGVLDAERVARAHVFGISMGGMIAQELALRHPERVRALALGATFGGHWRSRKPGVGVALDLALAALLARSVPRMARLLVSEAFYAGHRDGFATWLGGISRAPRAVARRQILAIARHEAESRLGALRVPTLVLTGDRDRLVPPENSRRLARVIPGARLVELPGAGHAFPFERPDETVRLLTEHFLAAP
ncbi:MAG TPA: alpha/beta fold hydrolase [Anaeromyxobacteraceae bacterium]|nr:alpha/beta fold hydrolase [Anaeromyxobacteraceae bacterium]